MPIRKGKQWEPEEYEVARRYMVALLNDQRFKDWPPPPGLVDELLALPGKSVPEWARQRLTDSGWARLLEALRNWKRSARQSD